MPHILEALFKTQPDVALDTFLLPTPMRDFDSDIGRGPALGNLDSVLLQTWADRDPALRYRLVGECLSMFGKKNGDEENELSPLFVSILQHAPNKRLFLGELRERLHPQSWGGSLADILIRRKQQVLKLAELGDVQVRAWVDDVTPELDSWIEQERAYDRAGEESFE